MANRRNHCIMISSTTDFENPTVTIRNILGHARLLTSTSWERLQSWVRTSVAVHTRGGDRIDDREQ